MDDQVRELVALGKEHFQRGDYQLAKSELEQVVAGGGAFADVHHMLGLAYHHLGDFPAAQKAFERALQINPGYVEAALNLAIVCNDLGQYERAQEVYGEAIAKARAGGKREPNGDEQIDPYAKGKLANLHADVGDGYLSVRRPNDAAKEYRRALTLCPGFVDLRLKLANALREAGDPTAALIEFRTAVHEAPQYVQARVSLGTALYVSGKLDEAVAQWEEVLKMDPTHRTAGMYVKLARAHALPGAAPSRRR